MKVLVIATHADDEVLGVGGMLQKHYAFGDHVTVAVITDRVIDHERDAKYVLETRRQAIEAQELLKGKMDVYVRFHGLNDEQLDRSQIEVIRAIERSVSEVQPSTVYLPWGEDLNQDHRAVYTAGLVATREVENVLCYEVGGSTQNFEPLVFMVLTEEEVARKAQAMNVYKSEVREFPHPRSDQMMKALAMRRGCQIRRGYAEGFRPARMLLEWFP